MHTDIGMFYWIKNPNEDLWIHVSADEADFVQIAAGEFAVMKLAAIEFTTQKQAVFKNTLSEFNPNECGVAEVHVSKRPLFDNILGSYRPELIRLIIDIRNLAAAIYKTDKLLLGRQPGGCLGGVDMKKAL